MIFLTKVIYMLDSYNAVNCIYTIYFFQCSQRLVRIFVVLFFFLVKVGGGGMDFAGNNFLVSKLTLARDLALGAANAFLIMMDCINR